MSLFSELKRRNVFRVAAAYLAGAWLLIEVSDTLFSIYGLPGTAARIIATLLVIGFPITLVLSWVYEITPDGLKLEKDIARAGPSPRGDTRRLDRVIIVLLILALGYFAVDKFVLEPGRVADIVEEVAQQARSEALVESYGEKSIAVLPFINMSADPEQEYFSDGISEELLNLLAQIPTLRVTARTSSFAFKGKDVPIPEIARQLNVAHVLEGSVRKSGDRVRITAQLIEARSDTHMWSESYDRTLDDIFAVQDEIAAAIGDALKVRLALGGGESLSPVAISAASTSAYDAYLRGRELVSNRDDMKEAVRLLEHAVQLDDNFAPAHAQLAIAISMLNGASLSEKIRRAVPHLDRALAIEPDLAEGHGGRALLAYEGRDWGGTIEHARRALATNPNYVDAMHWLYGALQIVGKGEEAETVREKTLAVDPLAVPVLSGRALALADQGRLEEAHALADQILARSLHMGSRVNALISMLNEGKLAESLAWALKASVDEYMAYWVFLWVGEYGEAGRVEAGTGVWADVLQKRWEPAIEIASELVHEHPDIQVNSELAAEAYFYARRFEEALPFYEHLLELAPENSPIGLWWNLTVTMNLAKARREKGDEQGAVRVADIVRQTLSARRAAGEQNMELDLSEGMLATFDHDRNRAIEALQSAVRRGFVFLVYIDGPNFDTLRGDPEFVALRREMEKMLDAEHEKVLQLICFNNPVPDVWLPVSETCEGVANPPD